MWVGVRPAPVWQTEVRGSACPEEVPLKMTSGNGCSLLASYARHAATWAGHCRLGIVRLCAGERSALSQLSRLARPSFPLLHRLRRRRRSHPLQHLVQGFPALVNAQLARRFGKLGGRAPSNSRLPRLFRSLRVTAPICADTGGQAEAARRGECWQWGAGRITIRTGKRTVP